MNKSVVLTGSVSGYCSVSGAMYMYMNQLKHPLHSPLHDLLIFIAVMRRMMVIQALCWDY